MADFNSKYTGAEVEALLDAVNGKQDEIEDLENIREGAALGATALQSIPEGYVTEDELIWTKTEGEAGVRLKGTNGTATGNQAISAGDDKTASDGTVFTSAASGDHAVAFGFGNTCSGRTTLAQGLYNTVSGKDSVAFGQRNAVNGDQAFAAGQQNEVTTRLGVAIGYQNKATNTNSIAIGYKNTSSGSGSVALGDTCESSGTSSTAMGHNTKAAGAYSATFGENTQATNAGEVAMGLYNKSTTSTDTSEQTLFSFGIGTSDTNRTNALEIKKNGDVYIGDKKLSDFATITELSGKVDKVSGKQLSTEDFTSTLKSKLEGLSNYDDTELSNALSTLRGDFDKLVSGDTTTAIKTFNEVIAFLDGIQDTQDLSSIIASIEQQIAGKMDKVTLATVATSGSYNDLSNKPTIPSEQVNADWNATSGKAQIFNKPTIPTSLSQLNSDSTHRVVTDAEKSTWDAKSNFDGDYNSLKNKPTIPSAVTESTVSGWGFTKNTGTYSKPTGGIPKSDLASAVQTSLTNADNAFTGSILGFKGGDFAPVIEVSVNGENKTPNTSGKLELGTFVNGVKANGTAVTVSNGEANIPAASTSTYGVTKLSSSTSSTSTSLAATASAVKAAYDLANGRQEKLTSGTNIKTINNQSILGSGNITIEGGSSVFITHFTVYEFISGNVEFTDEQVEAIRDAARENKIIALPFYDRSETTGFLVSSYDFYESEESDLWSLNLTIAYSGAEYSNALTHDNLTLPNGKLSVTPFTALVEYTSVDEDGYAIADSFNKDNIIVFVEGECRYLQIFEVGPEYGMTVRFFTGEDCTIDYWGNWANGVIPTIEPYTAYEMSIVYGADNNPCAVLTPFKQVE